MTIALSQKSAEEEDFLKTLQGALNVFHCPWQGDTLKSGEGLRILMNISCIRKIIPRIPFLQSIR
jgi:hypothetical protein